MKEFMAGEINNINRSMAILTMTAMLMVQIWRSSPLILEGRIVRIS